MTKPVCCAVAFMYKSVGRGWSTAGNGIGAGAHCLPRSAYDTSNQRSRSRFKITGRCFKLRRSSLGGVNMGLQSQGQSGMGLDQPRPTRKRRHSHSLKDLGPFKWPMTRSRGVSARMSSKNTGASSSPCLRSHPPTSPRCAGCHLRKGE